MPAPDYGTLLDRLRGVTWPARVPSRGATAGTHPSRLRGASAEFTEYRAYRQGDDPRRLDWKLLARTDRAFLRVTNERATLATLLAVDASASMAFPADSAAKWSLTRAVAVGLAGVAHAAGDPVALTVAATPVRRLPFRARRGVVGDVAKTLDAVTPAGSVDVSTLVRDQRRAGRIVLITDLLGDEAGSLRAAREHVTRGVEVVLVHVVAREEIDPPAGARLALDPERADVRRTLSDGTREAYRTAFAGWRAAAARAWRAAGARYVEIVTGEPPDRAVRRLVSS